MSYGTFESLSTDNHDENLRQAAAARSLDLAHERVTAKFGSFLAGAEDRGDFNDRVAWVKPEMMKVVEAAGVMPVTGVMRKVIGAQKTRWQKRADRISDFQETVRRFHMYLDRIYYKPNKASDLLPLFEDFAGEQARAIAGGGHLTNEVMDMMLDQFEEDPEQFFRSASVVEAKTAATDGNGNPADLSPGALSSMTDETLLDWGTLEGVAYGGYLSDDDSDNVRAEIAKRGLSDEARARLYSSRQAGVDDEPELIPEDNWDGYLNERETEETNKVRDHNFTSARKTAAEADVSYLAGLFEDYATNRGWDPYGGSGVSEEVVNNWLNSGGHSISPEDFQELLVELSVNGVVVNGSRNKSGSVLYDFEDWCEDLGKNADADNIDPYIDSVTYLDDPEDVRRELREYFGSRKADLAFEAAVLQADSGAFTNQFTPGSGGNIVSPDSQVPMDTGAGNTGTVEDVAPTDPGYAEQTASRKQAEVTYTERPHAEGGGYLTCNACGANKEFVSERSMQEWKISHAQPGMFGCRTLNPEGYDRFGNRRSTYASLKTATGYPPEEIEEMRAWASQFGYLSNALSDSASAEDVLAVIKKEYPGGLTQWNADAPPVLPEPDPGAWDGTSDATPLF